MALTCDVSYNNHTTITGMYTAPYILEILDSLCILCTHAPHMALTIPGICQFWDTIALFSPVKIHQKGRKFVTR